MGYKIGNISILTKKSDNKQINKYWKLIYARKGSGLYMYDGAFRCIDECDILFLPPSVSCSFDPHDLGDEYNANLETSVMLFDEQWLDAFLKVFPNSSNIILSIKESRVPSSVIGTKWLKLSELLNRILSCQPEEEPLLIYKILGLIANSAETTPISGASVPQPDPIEKRSRIDRFLSCNLHRKFSLDEIATYAGMNRTYFCLFFKKHYGISLTDHVNNLRIDMACKMIREENSSISEIAKACGFPTVTYFNRIFKKKIGVTPRELHPGC